VARDGLLSLLGQALLVLLLDAGAASGQGLTGAALEGRVLLQNGTAVEGATVTAVNRTTGTRWQVRTRTGGRYLLENLEVGGPYVVSAAAPGLEVAVQSALMLALGQRVVLEFILGPGPLQLPDIVVTSPANRAGDPLSGPGTLIEREDIDRLPNAGRDFLGLLTLSPFVSISESSGSSPTGGITIAGQNRLYNAFRIDGGLNHDLYEGRLAGRETLRRPIAQDALEEIQVLVAPFDVRYGSFAGGLVNAVTRSGGNQFHGSGFAFLSDAALVGRGGANGTAIGDFTTWNLGLALGGPIVRDRAHFFLSLDRQHEVVPGRGPSLSDLAPPLDVELTGVTLASARRFQTILDSLGVTAGSLDLVAGNRRATDLFGKVTVQLRANHRLELSHHYARGDRWGFITRVSPIYDLSTTSQHDPSTVHTSRAIWTGLIGSRWSNQLIVSGLSLRDECRPEADYTEIRVNNVSAVGGALQAGALSGCPLDPRYAVAQDAFELTDHLTAVFGPHMLTFGVAGEMVRLRDSWLDAASGRWVFQGLNALAAGNASRYQRALPGSSWGDGLDFRGGQIGLYAQDRWQLRPNLTVTLGLRADRPILPDEVARNDLLDASLGVRTGFAPADHLLWSPRLGFSYDGRGARPIRVHGGVGLFSGPPPYRWLANAYRDDGTRELFLDCANATGHPRPPFHILTPPTTCGDGSGPLPRLSSFAPETRFPQSLRVSVGMERELVPDLVTSADVLYTRAVHQLAVRDANLAGVQGVAQGEAGRPLYGTALGTPTRLDPAFGRVVVVENSDGDHSVSFAVGLRHQASERLRWDAGYAFTRSRDRMSLINGGIQQQLENTASDGPPERRSLRPSYFEVPHRVEVGMTWNPGSETTLSLRYSGASGTPFTYVVRGLPNVGGDINSDGVPPTFANDPVYIPRGRSDITIDGNGTAAGLGSVAEQDSVFAAIEARIQSEKCLRERRGQLLERNGCRNPWFGTVGVRAMKGFRLGGARSFTLTADVYNLFALVGLSWGERRLTAPDAWWQGPQLAGWDATAGRGVYSASFREPYGVDDLASRWRTELTLRYAF
jgi:hypothetical protein